MRSYYHGPAGGDGERLPERFGERGGRGERDEPDEREGSATRHHPAPRRRRPNAG